MKTADLVTAAGLHVVRMTPQDETAYDAFVAAHPEAMLYHSLPYVRMIASITGGEQETLLAVDDGGTVRGVLPLLAKSGPLGRVINSLPYYGSHGGVLAETPAAGRALTDAYNALLAGDGLCSATVIGNPLAAMPAGLRHSVTDYRIGQFTRIEFEDRHAERLMQAYHQKTRNMVRKGERSGVETDEENGLVEFLTDVHRENMPAIGGRAKSEPFFSLFPRHFKAGRDYKLFVARLGGEPVAAMLLFYFRDTVEYYTPVIREAYRDKQPLSLLIHHAMTEASERGYRLWNWGGTWATQDGVYLFKKRWGTYDVNYTYYTQVNNDAVLASSSRALLEQYPDFFVVPFRLLEARG